MPTVSLSAMDSPLMNVNSCNMRTPKYEKSQEELLLFSKIWWNLRWKD